jgi:nitrate reductase gamma subunit
MGAAMLAFARGPGLWFALAVFVLGTGWRLLCIARRPSLADLSVPRAGAPSAFMAALHANIRMMWPRPAFIAASRYVAINGYVFHVGLALVFFGYAPHIAFVRRLTGLAWPALPDAVMYLSAAATIIALCFALVWRLGDPVRRRISRPDDAITWTLTFLPMLTGMAVVGEPSQAILGRQHLVPAGPLALHLLALELLLIWFPFGKLMHALLFVFSRGATGRRFGLRGVRL